jgi:hypothetical protein
MWILSQNELSITNCSDIFVSKDNDKVFIKALSISNHDGYDPFIKLGEYKTIERAKEIIIEIGEEIFNESNVYEMPEE